MVPLVLTLKVTSPLMFDSTCTVTPTVPRSFTTMASVVVPVKPKASVAVTFTR